MTGVVLLVSDDPAITTKTVAVLESMNHAVAVVSSQELANRNYRLMDSLLALVALEDRQAQHAAIGSLNQLSRSLPVFLLRRPAGAAKAMANPPGVCGLIRLPLRYRDMIDALQQARLRDQKNRTGNGLTITGNSTNVQTVSRLACQVAATEANVLLSGESGTGKEVVARSIHSLSLRADAPFVAINCGAIPAELLESELFGHEKGAFTGAFQARAGRFELAEGGTLFLDEIGDMPLNMQVKLLRVIQERCFERVGGTRSRPTNVRLIAATHQNLEQRIENGEFRLDLFYRLNVFPIELPPLRERPEDIPLLIEEFIQRCSCADQPPISFDAQALQMLMGHRLPGNVRELENLIERLSILYPGEEITGDKLPPRYRHDHFDTSLCAAPGHALPGSPSSVQISPVNAKIDLKQYLASLERSLICRALEHSDWVVSQAARTLSVRRTTLIEKIRKLEIKPPREERRDSTL